MKKYLWVHYKALQDINSATDAITLTADQFLFGTEEELEYMARDSGEWHQFKETDERLA